jgi:hypothetical protein
MQVRSKFVVSVVSLLGVIACGDDEGGSGVPSSKKIGELNESEARSLCRDMADKMKKIGDAQNQLICIGTGITIGQGDRAECQDAADECLAENDGGFELDCDGEDGEPASEGDDCADVTVGEFNACLDAEIKALEAVTSKVTCSSDLDELEELESADEAPAACVKIADRCEIADMG